MTASDMKRGIAVTLGVAMALGGVLIARGGWPIALLGLAAMLAALAYTGGPFPLAYHGLGEVAVAIFFGGVGVLGTVYLQLGELPWLAWVAAVAVAAHASAILVVNNLRISPEMLRPESERWRSGSARMEPCANIVS
ncbi:MAG: UbiA family prenyltransferase [Thermomicrobiales bacterium]